MSRMVQNQVGRAARLRHRQLLRGLPGIRNGAGLDGEQPPGRHIHGDPRNDPLNRLLKSIEIGLIWKNRLEPSNWEKNEMFVL